MRILKFSGNPGEKIISELGKIRNNEKGKPIRTDLIEIEEIFPPIVSVRSSDFQNDQKPKYASDIGPKVFDTNEIDRGNFEGIDSLSERSAIIGGKQEHSFEIGMKFLQDCRRDGKKACLIVFDSHFTQDGGWMKNLIEAGFPCEDILLVGARNLDSGEIAFLSENKVRQINLNQIERDIDEASDVIMEFSSGKELYACFDIDIIDSAFASGVFMPETGGMTARQAIYIVSRMSLMRNLRIFELNGISGETNDLSALKLGAKIVSEIF